METIQLDNVTFMQLHAKNFFFMNNIPGFVLHNSIYLMYIT